MPDLSTVGDFITSLDSQAAAWYRGVTGTPVVVPATNPAIAAQQQIAINQAAQASLLNTNPVLAGVLANPIVLILALVFGVVLLLIVLK